MSIEPSFDTAFKQLVEARKAQFDVVSKEQAKLTQLDAAIAALETTVKVDPVTQQVHRQDFVGIGIIEGSRRIFAERDPNTELSTREIADELRARGVTTTSRRFVPTVYATLRNQTHEFDRVGKVWQLRARRRPNGADSDSPLVAA